MSVMKKKFEAFLREENSLRELTVTDAGKPSVDPAFLRRWQNKINLIAMESKRSVVLILRVTHASISVLLKSGRIDQNNIENYLENGLYLESGLENSGLLITNRVSGESQDDNSTGMPSITTCFGLPIQWPDEVLFGVICVLNQSGKTLKQANRNTLFELRETIEQELILLLHRQGPLPQTSETGALKSIHAPIPEQEPVASPVGELFAQKTETGALKSIHFPIPEQEPAASPIQEPVSHTSEADDMTFVHDPIPEQKPVVSPVQEPVSHTSEADDVPSVHDPIPEQKPAVSPVQEPVSQTSEEDDVTSVHDPIPEQKPAVSPHQDQSSQPSETDVLTSIYSRKKIEDILKHEFDRAKRYFKTFTVTIIDLNGYQEIGDSLGRDVRDDVLKAFAQSVGSKIRETDYWGIWGGDTFVLVCPYADTVETQQMFTRIKPLVCRDMKAIKVFSDFYFGVSQYEPDDLTYQAIVNRAEENMVQYKEMVRRKSFAAADDQNAGIR